MRCPVRDAGRGWELAGLPKSLWGLTGRIGDACSADCNCGRIRRRACRPAVLTGKGAVLSLPVQPVPAVLAVLRRSRDCRRGGRDCHGPLPRRLLPLLPALLLRHTRCAVLLPANRRVLPAGHGLFTLALFPTGFCRAGSGGAVITPSDSAAAALSCTR